MKGTPTIGKAKSLKEKRELAAELGMFYPLLLSPPQVALPPAPGPAYAPL